MQRRYRATPRLWLFLTGFMLVCFSITFIAAQVRYGQISDRLAHLNQQKAALANQVSTLSQQLDYVRSDDYVERVARDELNMIMPGEIRYVSN